MNTTQQAQALRILACAASELADVLDGGDAAAAASDTALSSLPSWAQKRAKYLQAFVDNGG